MKTLIKILLLPITLIGFILGTVVATLVIGVLLGLDFLKWLIAPSEASTFDVVVGCTDGLRDYQRAGVDCLRNAKHVSVSVPPGCGKLNSSMVGEPRKELWINKSNPKNWRVINYRYEHWIIYTDHKGKEGLFDNANGSWEHTYEKQD